MTFGSLFAGIGGFDLRLSWKSWISRRIGVRTQLNWFATSVSSLGSLTTLKICGASRCVGPVLGSVSQIMCIFQSRHLAARSSCLM